MAVDQRANDIRIDQIQDELSEIAGIIRAAKEALHARTDGGRRIDEAQVLTRKLARLATHAEAVKCLVEYAVRFPEPDAHLALIVEITATALHLDTAQALQEWLIPHRLVANETTLGISRLESNPPLDSVTTALGRRVLDDGAEWRRWIWSSTTEGSETDELRETTRRFAREMVAPRAEEIHRRDLLVPDDLISAMANMGYFGMSIPESYGGSGVSNVAMVVATEELSAASLSAAGSLITRPEILARALLEGGTEDQKRKWLPRIASGESMVAVAVTEPDVGSDVASITCRATAAERNGEAGYVINGAKAWCTFAGRAEILALLARTDPDESLGHKGLSLFIVEKAPFTGHEFEWAQPDGGRLTGKADATLGYRGMHSFTLQFNDYFVPAENLIGGTAGLGRGFYLQMDGFAAGRLQTAGRAVGLAQASLEAAVDYTKGRPQFGRPIAAFESTAYEIGRMAVHVEAARQLTHAAARARDVGDECAGLLAAMAKLYACRVAVDVSQRAQILHGGWGYAEEYAISRYVVDALVLPIFEGVEPILELKVIGRGLLSG